MRKILINNIFEALSCGEKAFRSLRNFELLYDERGMPRFVAGRNSVVVQMHKQGVLYGLKCYTAPLVCGEQIGLFAATLPDNLIIRPQILCEELWVVDRSLDVAIYPWVDGHSAEWLIRKAIHDHDTALLATLEERFIDLVVRILEQEWRHGDIKTENIVVRPDGEMILVDCDSLYSPALPKRANLGTPLYIHPLRKDAYDSHIDDYAIALIVLSLEALRREVSLFSGESMVALPSEGNTERIRELFEGNNALLELLDALLSDDYKIPNLKDILKCITHR